MRKLIVLWFVVAFLAAISIQYTAAYLISPMWVVNVTAAYFLLQYRKMMSYHELSFLFSFTAIMVASICISQLKDLTMQAMLSMISALQVTLFLCCYYLVADHLKQAKYFATLILTIPNIVSSFIAAFVFMLMINYGENYFELVDYFLEQFATGLSLVCLFYGFSTWRSIDKRDYGLMILVLVAQYFISTDAIFYACIILPFLMGYFALKYHFRQFAFLVGSMTLICAMYVALPLTGEYWSKEELSVLSRASTYRVALGSYLMIFLFICEMHWKNRRFSLAFERMMFKDELTGLKNRRFIREKIEKHTVVKSGFLVLLDLDDFKRVNDHYGHHVGDLVLQKMSQILKQVAQGEHIVSRWGGEEFLVLAPNQSAQACHDFCQRLLNACRQNPCVTESTVITISVSIGAVAFDEMTTQNYNRIVQIADQRLYEAKLSGKDTYVFES